MLDRFMPNPRLVQVDVVEVATTPEHAYEVARRFDSSKSALVRSLFVLHALPERMRGRGGSFRLAFDEFGTVGPNLRVLADEPGRGFAVGAIGCFWKLEIPFVDFEDFATFQEPGMGKVAWAILCDPLGPHATRIALELRVTATDEATWKRMRRYLRIIGPFSHFLRRHLLSMLVHELGTPEAAEQTRALPGDEWLPDAAAQATDGITIEAPPEDVWPWLVQMGCRRAGWYSHDWLDHGGIESAREIRPELQHIAVGDMLPARPKDEGGFEVLAIHEGRSMVLGGLYDLDTKRQLLFGETRPRRYWQTTWAFSLEPHGKGATRLTVRGRIAYAPGRLRLNAMWIAPVHHFMQAAQLRHLKERAERKAHSGWRDVAEGIVGAAGIALDLVTPFLRPVRSHWGVDEKTAADRYPGDELVANPQWSWTHGVEIDAPPDVVWPWIAQIGQNKGGFYSYQWLENITGCEIQNANCVHPEWARMRVGDELRLHPSERFGVMPIVAVHEGRWFLAHAAFDPKDRHKGATWLFYVEPLPGERSRFISRFRSGYPNTIKDRLMLGYITEAVGFVMDRRMLLGVKERVEHAA